MTIPKNEKDKNFKKFFFGLAFLFLGVCVGLLATWCFRRENTGQEPDADGTDFHTRRADDGVAETDFYAHRTDDGVAETDTIGTNATGEEGTDLIVDYPFAYGYEDWQLVLHENSTENKPDQIHSRKEFRLYNGDGQLIQTFPCILEAEELTFRFDRLFYYYGYCKDLVIFPADASVTGAKGLCYPWEEETEKFPNIL